MLKTILGMFLENGTRDDLKELYIEFVKNDPDDFHREFRHAIENEMQRRDDT